MHFLHHCPKNIQNPVQALWVATFWPIRDTGVKSQCVFHNLINYDELWTSMNILEYLRSVPGQWQNSYHHPVPSSIWDLNAARGATIETKSELLSARMITNLKFKQRANGSCSPTVASGTLICLEACNFPIPNQSNAGLQFPEDPGPVPKPTRGVL